jgi:hypothetical protein
MKDQFATTGGGVDRLLQAFKPNSSLLKTSDSINQVSKRPSQPIQAPDNKGVTSPEVGECFCQSRAIVFCAADSIGVDLLTACLFEGIALEIKVLIVS